MSLEGKVALITGSARGLGRETALTLAKKGVDVAIPDILLDQAKATSEEIKALGRRSIALKIDVSDYSQVEEGFARVVSELGPIDILVNNAALTTNVATISKMDKKNWDREISINLSGVFYCIKQVFDSMAERKWGRIINISSVAGILGGFGQCGYSSCKAGVIGLAKTVAIEGARVGITCNVVAPGVVKTDAYYVVPEKMRERINKRTAMGFPGEPMDVAEAIAFLTSEEAKYITGQVLMVGGGIDLFTF
jgi:3-oxoacyl-[acyl-carrier protein] reductase